ncbi:MAG: microcin ABC transporter ATP-binding protein, partial [Clostridia bacterium]|nr:microcin ABC transporter ATP-binding protein [Clostridia bacterium]
PSSAADIEGTEIIEKAIAEYKNKTGCGILMTTHSPGQARRLADRIVILHKGEIAEEGSPEELLSSPKSLWGKRFIDFWKFDK